MSFLTHDQIRTIRAEYGTPVYVYDQKTLEAAAREVLAFPNAFGLTARYAMKALPTAAVLRIFLNCGLAIDASSGHEAWRALRAGVRAGDIQLTTQQLPADLAELVERGVLVNACSLRQLETFGQLFAGGEVGVRINPGLGSGHNNRTNVGGPSSSFGIWHEKLDRVFALQRKYDLRISRMHTHIGSGGDPSVWENCARLSLAIAARLPEVERLSLGGGFKVGRMPGESSADLQAIGNALLPDFENFADRHGRRLQLEIEPGTFLVARAGALISEVIDVVDTGVSSHTFIKIDSGMTEILRPALYGAQHPIELVPADGGEARVEGDYLVVGHCCESGDVLTPEPGDPEGLRARRLPRSRVGDGLLIGAAGAYCSALAGKHYNSFPEAPEGLVTREGARRSTRPRQGLDQLPVNALCN